MWHKADAKRGKRNACESWLVCFDFWLAGQESGASFLIKSASKKLCSALSIVSIDKYWIIVYARSRLLNGRFQASLHPDEETEVSKRPYNITVFLASC